MSAAILADMSSEIKAVATFLAQTAPFQFLSDDRIAAISRKVTVRYAKAGSAIIRAGDHNDHLFVVRSGAVELRLAGDELTARLGTGSSFAYPSLLRGGEVHNTATASEDTLLYTIPAEQFHALRSEVPAFRQFFAEDEAARIKHALADRKRSSAFQLDTKRLGDLIVNTAPISCPPDASIASAVGLMHEHDVSTLAICNRHELRGIFTDKDLRNRVVAQEIPLDRAVSEVMTASPRTLPTEATAAEAMALMAAGGFRHIPLVKGDGGLAGILSATDILSAIGSNAIDAGTAIFRARTADALIEAAQRVPQSFAAMTSSGFQASHAMQFTSALGEAVHRRAAQLAEEELGEPPCPYALVVFGSLARREQLVGSDQDNGLVIAEDQGPDGAAYFKALGSRISDLLDASGYVYCKGGIMARKADQRLTQDAWLHRYDHWISEPTEDRILRATIFFDMRCVYGEASLVRSLRSEVVAKAASSSIFISYLARDALRSKVPLGIFRNLVLEKSDDGQKVFDAKAQAIMPIIDIARTLALAHGLNEVGTVARLEGLAQSGSMSADDAQSLSDAMLFVNELRIAHQARQVEKGASPDNLISPYSLSPLERDYLKDAFAVIRQGLDALRRNYAGGIT
ncbi:putative nucleotidyltransferase substrate binding domain-containing protein [Erythrobacter rubeus]|uniref:CBS domain-containing protein n=1 Tax=Erythrobacter rubeus TaxID=2760803 RepID=A0ABR8KP87_9SPHN|nr:putative nucleotidyltransferase substrate binding domain-containing protein [Erythrobacter rubeus]MBD2842469.1 CBS domain-containing protein [Erythrobacter rubeus]